MSVLIIWNEHGDYHIRDLHNKWHDRVLQFMLEHYYRPHRLYAASEMQQDDEVTEDFCVHMRHILNGECCILAVDEERNEIEAAAIMKWMSRMWRSWTMLEILANTQQWREIVTLQRRLLDAGANMDPDHPYDGLHLFEYYVSEKLRGDAAFMMKFFGAIFEVGRHMKMPRVTFVALSAQQRAEVEAAGFTDIVRFMYSMYVNKQGLRPFTTWRDLDEMYATLYEHPLDPITPYTEMHGFEELEERMRQLKLRMLAL